MKYLKNILIGAFLCLGFISCSEDLLDKEHYKTEIFLVGGYDRVWTMDVKYTDEPFENFFSVSSSGSLNLGKDVQVKMGIDEELVDIYNDKFFGVLNKDKFFKPLPQEIYEIPSLTNTVINHKEQIYKRVPILINTVTIDPDCRYVIPIRIEEVSDFEVNKSGEKMLVLLNMLNDYSGTYQLDGSKTVEGENAKRIQKIKNLKAISKDCVRMFWGAENEIDDNLSSSTIYLKVTTPTSSENDALYNVEIHGWDELEVENGSGTYDSNKQEFDITYTLIEDGKKVVYHEVLTNNDQDIK